MSTVFGRFETPAQAPTYWLRLRVFKTLAGPGSHPSSHPSPCTIPRPV